MALNRIQDLFFINKTVSSPREKFTNSATAASGTVNFDSLTNSVLYYTTNATSNWTTNIRGNANNTFDSVTRIGEAFTVVFLATQGTTAYYQTGFTIDGVSVTPKWVNGTAPTSGSVSSIDAYTFYIFKTAAATYTVLASRTKFA